MKTPGFFTRKWDTKGVGTLTWAGLQSHPTLNVKTAEKVFLTTARVLNQLGIKFWLNTGTALGAVRDKGIIPSDIDVDVTLFAKDCNLPVILGAFTRAGFQCTLKLYPTLHKDKLSGIVVSMSGVAVDVDLVYYYPPEDVVVALDVKPHNHGTVQPAKFYKGDNFIDFLGIKVRIPYPPEEYFELHYGKQYRIPCDDWSWMDIREPISIDKYIAYFHEHPEVNQK